MQLYTSLFRFSRLVPRQRLTLNQADPTIYGLIQEEIKRQRESINLIPSENHSSKAVLEALGSVMSTKYAEGYPGARYYGGTQVYDKVELLCQQRALNAFNLNSNEWGVNVQMLSGAPANFAIYTGLLSPKDRIMSLDLPHGGHLSHGYQTETKKVSAVSSYFEVMPYRLNEETELIDYEQLEVLAKAFRPKLIVAGASAYARIIDFQAIRKICDSVKAYLLADISHTAGMMAAEQLPSPFPYADVVMTTTHKSMRGPRGSLIFYRVGQKEIDKTGKPINYDLKTKIDQAVFPGLQGGPHFHTITSIAVALEEAKTPEFKNYQKNVLSNSKKLADELLKRNFSLVSGGTDNHLVLVNLKPKSIDGARVESILQSVNISVNKNTVPKDKSALVPNGLRMGSVPMTSRGVNQDEFAQIADFIDRGVAIAQKVKGEAGPKVQDFKDWLAKNGDQHPDIQKLKKDVVSFSSQFPVPGLD
ncbi:unnamed protein product (macronuclear) [Paramecium tetraurelia]|uniref:glycine hydroxymethyltransferase n=1 Tax=Paramecium tetraurelia TaxID=5888 RepID=A0BRC5_PARTE|nr:uncharacterized protein GSPATT00031323001 [Paramecium tetraurelia]CAK61092.1 unnamed protein product [Paramecium tetraurelia]|eukprot:XP_001428490.1 hypothetical protein (macronuclear) [Paramecium tetraurelia strain d4-2]